MQFFMFTGMVKFNVQMEVCELRVGVIGYSGRIDEMPVKALTDICESLGKSIAKSGHILVTGGRDGVMELVSKAAKESGGTVVGILPETDEGNPYLSFGIETGMDFAMRSVLMMYNVDVVISIGGKAGTALELFAAYGKAKPILLLRGTGGWTDRITNVLLEEKYLDERKSIEVKSCWDVDEIMEEIEKLEASL